MSHPRNKDMGISVNGNTPSDLTKVQYTDFDQAVRLCFLEGRFCYIGKSDMTSAFRHLCIKREHWKYLVMKAQSPIDGKWYYFVDKCLPFGASISCSHFQNFSDAIAHIVTYKTRKENVNYLDDFFFVAFLKAMCNDQINTFLEVCGSINFPVSMEKTFWGTTKLVFLGLLIDTVNQLICVPQEKVEKAKFLINRVLSRKNNKIRLRELQSITGFLNFLGKATVPGRAFTRRLYSAQTIAEDNEMKKYHHIHVNSEMKSDLKMWLKFLEHPSIYARSFMDLINHNYSDVDFYTDASANPELGCGGVSDSEWFLLQWEENFITKNKPSINYLELYAVTIAVINWLHKYQNRRIYIFCDNMSVVHMINNNTSKCKNCMVLIRIIVLQSLTNNVRLYAKHVPGRLNLYSDYLSRLKYKHFWDLARSENRKFNTKPSSIPDYMFMPNIWLKDE